MSAFDPKRTFSPHEQLFLLRLAYGLGTHATPHVAGREVPNHLAVIGASHDGPQPALSGLFMQTLPTLHDIPKSARASLEEDGLFVRYTGMSFDIEEFFKKQIEECRELESQAVSAEDRAFWRQAVGRWEEQLRQAKDANTKRALRTDA
jgi:hypothetical protein